MLALIDGVREIFRTTRLKIVVLGLALLLNAERRSDADGSMDLDKVADGKLKKSMLKSEDVYLLDKGTAICTSRFGRALLIDVSCFSSWLCLGAFWGFG